MKECENCKVRKWFKFMFDMHICEEDCPYKGKSAQCAKTDENADLNGKKG